MSESALRNPNYVIYLAGNSVSLCGLWLYRVALGWFAWELSQSELWVGIVAFTQFAPAVVFGPIFGVLADRFDRRATSILINSLSVLNMLLLGMLTSLGFIDIRVLVLLSLMQGVLDGAHAPVRMSIVPNLVERDQLRNAIALTSVSFNLSRFVGPAIAGLVIAVWGVGTAFVINGVSYLTLIWAMCVVDLNPSSKPREERKHPWHELVDGARYAFTHRTIRGLLLLAALGSVFGRGALEMLPAFADAVYRGGASALAILTSAIGGGAVLAGLTLSRGARWLTSRVINVAVGVSGLLVIALGALDRFPLAVVVVSLLGISLSLSGVGSQILIQTLVEDELRGRVSSFWGMIAFGGTSLGSLLVGAAAHAWGLQNAVIGTGILCVALALARRSGGHG
ncbi:MAG: MFS transporter [Woeseiaceae bacterium]